MFQARVEPLRGATPITLDATIDLARQRVPDARFLNAFLPTRPDQALRIGLIRPGHAEGAPIITVIVDPWRHSVVDVFDPRTLSTGESIIAWQRALHYGIGLGGHLQVFGLRLGRDHSGLRHDRLLHVVDQAPQPPRR